MDRKIKQLLLIYTVTALAVLSVLSAVLYERLERYSRAALYSSGAAFETAVKAAEDMSAALKKSIYATDGSMCAGLCSEIYADALAAEASITALPFNTFELERVSAFVNTAGDYAYMLCSNVSDEGFTEEQAENLHSMAETAAELAGRLREMQRGMRDGTAVMDETQRHLYNVGEDGTPKLSEAMLEYEGNFPEAKPLRYDGRYTAEEEKDPGTLTAEDAEKLAAAAAGVEPRELKHEYEYESEDGLCCYSAGDMLIIVSGRGLESMSRTRLVTPGELSAEDASAAAEKFLKEQGFENMRLTQTQQSGGLIALKFAAEQEGALCEDNFVTVSVATDDGKIYSLNATKYSPDSVEVQWNISEETAREKLPEGIEVKDAEKVIIKSAGKLDVPCYKFSCKGENDTDVRIYVSADKGRQCRIEV